MSVDRSDEGLVAMEKSAQLNPSEAELLAFVASSFRYLCFHGFFDSHFSTPVFAVLVRFLSLFPVKRDYFSICLS